MSVIGISIYPGFSFMQYAQLMTRSILSPTVWGSTYGELVNIANRTPYDPDEIATRRAIGRREVDEREVVEDIKPSYFLVDDVPAVLDGEILRELGHRARVGRWAPLPRVRTTFEPGAGSPVRYLDAGVGPAVEVGVAGGLDNLSASSTFRSQQILFLARLESFL